jgi:lysophospholipase L1-like esterase
MNPLRSSFLVWVLLLVSEATAGPPNAWIATWATSPEPGNHDQDQPLLKIEDQTVRERARVSVGGARICIRLSNEYGTAPVVIGSVTVGAADGPAGVRSGSIQPVTFSGHNSATIPAAAPILSDPVEFPVGPGAEISVSIYFPKRVASPTLHALALKRTILSQRGDHTQKTKIDAAAESGSSILLSAVLVPARPSQRLIVAFGDSITDGDGSTLDADQNWPSHLVRRLGKAAESHVAVVNAGISGNRLLSDGFFPAFGASALARYDRDAMAVPGVTHIVLFEGINDISFPGARLGGRFMADPADVRSPEDLIGAYRQLIARAHTHGIKVIGGTIAPCEGTVIPGYYSSSKEIVRQVVNKWIRTGGAFDGVIDFDAALRDPNHPSRLSPRFASEDHLHPNDAGYRAMAEAIDLTLFK